MLMRHEATQNIADDGFYCCDEKEEDIVSL